MNNDTVEDEMLIQNILAELLIKAYEDGVVSEDEKKILDKVKLDLKRYKELIDKSLEDGVITKEEQVALLEFKKEILKNAYQITKKDHVITNEERDLINLLIKTLIHHLNP